MKVLYLSELKPKGLYGGSIIEDRNKRIISKNFEIESVGIYAEGRNLFQKIKDVILSKVPTLFSRTQVSKIKKKIKNSDAKILFTESSRMGYFIKYAKKHGYKCITFLHNCEQILFKNVRGKLYLPFIKKQEKLTLEYSDYVFYLNQRDKNDFDKLYKVKNNFDSSFLPVSFKDSLNEEDLLYMQNKKKGKTGLFLGAYFGPNYEGIKWFISNVLNNINAKIQIVGKDFEQHKELLKDNVELIGTVDSTKQYLKNADFVVLPIFDGSGMKVKTCECLMFGKKIFASDEALTGYDVEESKAAIRCNSKEDFIKNINDYLASSEPIFNKSARNLFLTKYSEDIIEKKIVSAINHLSIDNKH